MAANIVCSDTYIDAFSRLDKKMQKKSLETIRLMQRSLRSDSLKIEKLNTKLDFKSARVTQDFRVIFTQAGNTVLLVYIDHHDDAYLWASRRLQGFDAANAKPAYEYFEQAKKDMAEYLDLDEEEMALAERKYERQRMEQVMANAAPEALGAPAYHRAPEPHAHKNMRNVALGIRARLWYLLLGIAIGVMVARYFL